MRTIAQSQTVDAAEPATANRAGWLVAAVLVYSSFAALLYPAQFAGLLPLYADAFARAVPPLLIGGLCIMALLFGRAAPANYIVGLLAARWKAFALVTAAFFIAITAFTTYKIAIPSIVPFHADPWLAELDESLHGTAPWRLAHWPDSDLWALFIFTCYLKIWFTQWFGTIFFSAFWSDKALRLRYLWALFLTFFICGTVLATLLASVGPIFYEQFTGEPLFKGLEEALDKLSYGYMVRGPAEYLLSTYQNGQASLGTGISAMPSMHIAIVTLNAYLLTAMNKWAGLAGWAFAALIFYGSVYTGWHYAVDGYVSFAVVSAIWWTSGRLIPTGRKRTPVSRAGGAGSGLSCEGPA